MSKKTDSRQASPQVYGVRAETGVIGSGVAMRSNSMFRRIKAFCFVS